MSAYQTLQNPARTDYVVQKSRFIGFAAPAGDADEALGLLDTIRREHRGASHNCFAYVIGQNKGIIRYSDDGEPSGTAGKPIAEVMLKKDVVDCIVVVTRYFGGILLGAGGLVRAYAHTASLALEAAGICTMHETYRFVLDIAYPFWDRVNYAAQSLPVVIENTEYAGSVWVSMLCRAEDEAAVTGQLTQITDGKIGIKRDGEPFYHPWRI